MLSSAQGAIYDCFPFFNELELLEIRLNELYDHVDKFVIVEATTTFRGDRKPLYFKKNKHLFEKFNDKIIHIVVSDRPYQDCWQADFYQRDQIIRGLIDCQPDDIIIISDADEIVRPSTIQKIVDELQNKKVPAVKCPLEYYFYFFNTWYNRPGNENNTVATTYRYLRTTSPNQIRWAQRRNDLGFSIIPNAGWHFSYMGGIERVAYKKSSFAHSEFDYPEYKSWNYIINDLRINGKIVVIDETFPKSILANLERYKEAGFIYLENSF